MKKEKPWVLGSKELLHHAEGHLHTKNRSGFDLRIAMISVDNAIEIMIKTFFSLPEESNGVPFSEAKKIDSHSFHALIQGISKFAKDKIVGIDLQEIQWFHGIRNSLYHSGNGITVEPNHAEVYLQVATTLYESLFGVNYEPKFKKASDLTLFLDNWVKVEKQLKELAVLNGLDVEDADFSSKLLSENLIDKDSYEEFNKIVQLRTTIVQGDSVKNPPLAKVTKEAESLDEKVSSNNRDFTKYSFNGNIYAKNRLVLAVIKDFVRKNPKLNFEDLANDFPKQLQGTHGVFARIDKANEVNNKSGDRYFTKSEDLVELQDDTIAVCTQWGSGNLHRFLEQCNQKGIEINAIPPKEK